MLDFIGAARPSIADPFLPTKIREGREDEIRECIGCNICRAANDRRAAALHAEPDDGRGMAARLASRTHRAKHADAQVLVVGGGPAGLECALALGRRGYEVTLAEARRSFGGRLIFDESTLPGLCSLDPGASTIASIMLSQELTNVSLYRESRLSADDIIELRRRPRGAGDGQRAGAGRHRRHARRCRSAGSTSRCARRPTTSLGGRLRRPDRWSSMTTTITWAASLPRQLAAHGHAGQLCDAGGRGVSSWTIMTNELPLVTARWRGAGRGDDAASAQVVRRREATLRCIYSPARRPRGLPLGADRRLGHRQARRRTMRSITRLAARCRRRAASGRSPRSAIACAPGSPIADAVYAGHRFAREFGARNAVQPRASGKGQERMTPPPRPAARARAGGIAQRPWKQLTRPYAPIEILSADQVETIHETALTILEEIGMRVLRAAGARVSIAAAGADVDARRDAGALRPRDGRWSASPRRRHRIRAARPQSGEERQGRRAPLHLLLGRRAGLCDAI